MSRILSRGVPRPISISGQTANELDETAERLRQEVAAFMTAIETHLFAEQARRDADSDRRIAGIQPLRRYYALHCSMYARLANLRDVLAKDM